MSLLAIVNGDVLTPQKVLEDATVLIEGERIVEIRQGGRYPAEATVLDARGGLVAPGLIDIMYMAVLDTIRWMPHLKLCAPWRHFLPLMA